jgi:hypothetical protein
MTLVASSDPGAVQRDAAWALLAERVVLTTAVCHELWRSDGRYADRRPRAALGLLLGWIDEHLGTGDLTAPDDGLNDMTVPAHSATAADHSPGGDVPARASQ